MTDSELARSIESAAERALQKLFAEHDEDFYYVALVTFGECECPIISAWSEQSLEAEARKRENPAKAKEDLRWDYAASPYCSFGYEEFFGELREIYDRRTQELDDTDDKAWEAEMTIRLDSMEQAMHDLDGKGLFGTGEERCRLLINAEYMPPDDENIERAKRLNPKAALKGWLEAFGEDNGDDNNDTKIDWQEIHNPKMCMVVLTKTIEDKRIAAELRRDFASPLTISEFLKRCSDVPFVIREEFEHKKATRIVEEDKDYQGLIKIEPL